MWFLHKLDILCPTNRRPVGLLKHVVNKISIIENLSTKMMNCVIYYMFSTILHCQSGIFDFPSKMIRDLLMKLRRILACKQYVDQM